MKKFVIVTNFIFYYDYFSPLNCKEEMRNISSFRKRGFSSIWGVLPILQQNK